jgi:hypothetical protein
VPVASHTLTEKSELLRFAVDDGGSPEPNLSLQGEFTVDLAVEEIPGVVGEDLDRTLANVLRAVDISLFVTERFRL